MDNQIKDHSLSDSEQRLKPSPQVSTLIIKLQNQLQAGLLNEHIFVSFGIFVNSGVLGHQRCYQGSLHGSGFCWSPMNA